MTARGESARRSPKLGRYELITRIGHGGMAEVQLALQRGPAGFEKLVVVKLVHENLASQKAFVDMLLDEARMAALVKHPNVVDIYDLGEDDGRYFIAMEYLEGEPLLAVLRAGRDGRRLDVLSTARLIADTAEGLDAAHELRSLAGDPIGLVHHDVSLGNIVVLYNGQVKLVDFGVAKASQSSTASTRIQGKFSYMAPEKLRGGAGDRRSDIWSLGCVLWEALTLRRLFKGANDGDTLRHVLEGEILPPSQVNGDVPADFDPICMRALDRDPARRYATAKTMATELEDALRKHGYAAKNDQIARYMQATFDSHIAARKKLLQEVSSKGRASPDLVEAAFHEGVAQGTPAPDIHSAEIRKADIEASRKAIGTDPLPKLLPQEPIEETLVSPDGQVPAVAYARPGRAHGAAFAASPPSTFAPMRRFELHNVVPLVARPGIQGPLPPRPARASEPQLPIKTAVGSGVVPAPMATMTIAAAAAESADSRPASSKRWLIYPAAAAAILAVVVVTSMTMGNRALPAQIAAVAAEAPPVVPAPSEIVGGMPMPVAAPTPVAEPAHVAAPPPADVAPPVAAPTPDVAPHVEEPPPAPSHAAEPPPTPPVRAAEPAPPHRVVATTPHPAAKPAPEKINSNEVFKSGLQAWVHGDTRTALASYKRVLGANPDFAPAWRGMGLVYEKLGDRPAARNAFQKYLRLAPDAPDASGIRARLEAP